MNLKLNTELPVWDDIGVDVKDDNGGNEDDDDVDSDDREMDDNIGLKINKACLKPGLPLKMLYMNW